MVSRFCSAALLPAALVAPEADAGPPKPFDQDAPAVAPTALTFTGLAAQTRPPRTNIPFVGLPTPNPSAGAVRLDAATPTTVSVVDGLGRRVRSVSAELAAGVPLPMAVPTEGLAPGAYSSTRQACARRAG